MRNRSGLTAISTLTLFAAVFSTCMILSSCNRSTVSLQYTNAHEEVPALGNLVFRFDKDLVKDSLLDRWDSTPYINFEPKIAGRFRWEHPDELVFSPAQPLTPATTFKATIKNDILQFSQFGRISKGDVQAFLSRPASEPAKPAAPKAPRAPQAGEERVKMTRLRKVVAERAVQSITSTAQLTSVVEVDVTKVAQFRDAHKAEFLEKTGSKLSFMPFFALAASEALKAHPGVNSSIDVAAGTQTFHEAEHLGIAVDTERGLVVPVIKDADKKSVRDLAGEVAALAEKARANKLAIDEMRGGTFTITNLGGIGGTAFTPLVNYPEVAILGLSRSSLQPVVRDGSCS